MRTQGAAPEVARTDPERINALIERRFVGAAGVER